MAGDQTYTVGSATAERGTRARGFVELTKRLDNTSVGIPVILVHGAEDGKTLLIDGGTHGDECEGMMAVQRVANQLDPAAVSGTLIAVPTMNYLAAEGMIRTTPKGLFGDALTNDVNRLFPGLETGTTAQRLANTYLNEVIRRADFMVSCHGAGCSFMIGRKVLYGDDGDDLGNRSRELAEAFGWEVICSDRAGYRGTSTGEAALLGIPSITPERGGSERLPASVATSISDLENGMLNVMRYLGMIEGEVARPERYARCDTNQHVHAPRDGLLDYDDDIELEGRIKAGQRVGQLLDVHGLPVADLISEWDGIITLLRSHPYVKQGDWICSVTCETAA